VASCSNPRKGEKKPSKYFERGFYAYGKRNALDYCDESLHRVCMESWTWHW